MNDGMRAACLSEWSAWWKEHKGQCDMEHIYWPVLGMTCLSQCGPTSPKNFSS